jgi:hypothetical protein
LVEINFEHINFLRPLIDWRMLDIENLIRLSKGKKYKSYDSARLLLKSLERKKVIQIYRDPWNKKNYAFLSKLGEKLIEPDTPNFLQEETFYHDSKVSALCYEILKLDSVFESVELEHKIKDKLRKNLFEEIVPDAKLIGNYNGRSFLAALELEFHQKEKSRILSKAKNYFDSSYYNHAFYFFPDESLMNIYFNIMKNELGADFNQKIFLFSDESIAGSRPNLREARGLVANKEITFFEVFKGGK